MVSLSAVESVLARLPTRAELAAKRAQSDDCSIDVPARRQLYREPSESSISSGPDLDHALFTSAATWSARESRTIEPSDATGRVLPGGHLGAGSAWESSASCTIAPSPVVATAPPSRRPLLTDVHVAAVSSADGRDVPYAGAGLAFLDSEQSTWSASESQAAAPTYATGRLLLDRRLAGGQRSSGTDKLRRSPAFMAAAASAGLQAATSAAPTKLDAACLHDTQLRRSQANGGPGLGRSELSSITNQRGLTQSMYSDRDRATVVANPGSLASSPPFTCASMRKSVASVARVT